MRYCFLMGKDTQGENVHTELSNYYSVSVNAPLELIG